MTVVFQQDELYEARVNIAERYFAPYTGVANEPLKITLDLANVSFYSPAATVAFTLKIAGAVDDRTNDIIANVNYSELSGDLYTFEYTASKSFSHIYLYIRTGTEGYTGVVKLSLEGPGARRTFTYDEPFVVASTEQRPVPVYKTFDIKKPMTSGYGTQSAAHDAGRYFVLHNNSIIQRYTKSGFQWERTITNGELIHPNDAQFYAGALWVCDTGTPVPCVKRVNVETGAVDAVYYPGSAGWRVAGVALESGQTLYVVAVRDSTTRNQLLVRRFDYATESILADFVIPVDPATQYYVQGCTLAGRYLYINTNSGAVPLALVVKVNLDTQAVEDTLTIDNFGETEGLDSFWLDRSLNLVTARDQAVFRIPL